MAISGVDATLLDALEAFGVVTPGGSLDAAWFANPIDRVSEVLTQPERRAAFERLVGRLSPEAEALGRAGERWHPLLFLPTGGDLYLTVARDAAGVSRWGAAAAWRGSAGVLTDLSFRARVPLVVLDAEGPQPARGDAISVELRIAIPGGVVGGLRLTAARVVLIAGVSGTDGLGVVLEGLDAGDGLGVRDVSIDPASFSEETVGLVTALLRAVVALPSGPIDPAHTAIVDHLLPLLGLADDIPPLPLAELAAGPAALRGWLRRLVTDESAKRWLGHLGGIFTGEAVPVEGAGTPHDPWTVRILTLGASSALSLTLARAGEAVQAGVRLRLDPGGAEPAAVLDAGAVLMEIPLLITAPMSALTAYELLLRAPGRDEAWLAGDADSDFAVHAIVAGLGGTRGAAPDPVLELRRVRIDGTEHARLDLSSANAVADAGKTLLRDALVAALGASATAQRLLALLGVGAPAADPGWPHALDLGAFVARPLAAVGSVHRRALADPAHSWSALFGELGALLGLAQPVEGAGQADDPWRLDLAGAAPLALRLVAFHETSAEASERLHLGLEVRVAEPPVRASYHGELLVVDFATDGDPSVRIVGDQSLAIGVSPVPRPPALPGMRISADAIEAAVTWNPGRGARGGATVSGLSVRIGAETLSLPALVFPSPGDPDPDDLGSGLGLDPAVLDALLRALLARAAVSWGGFAGFAATALLGVHGTLADLPTGWPTLRASGGAASILDDPGAALQDFLRRLCDVPLAAVPFLPAALSWLGGILARELPGRLVDPLGTSATVVGRGVRDEPWTLPLAGGDANVDVWLEPDGPPAAWAAYLAPTIAQAQGAVAVLAAAHELARWDGLVAAALARAARDRLPAALGRLAHSFAQGDGLVPWRSAVPSHTSWEQGPRLRAAHLDTPRDPDAIATVLDRLEALAPVGARVAILVSPSFGDGVVWEPLLAAASARGHAVDPGARWDLRVPGVDPLAVSLDGVTAVADHYVVVLGEAADLPSRTAQIGRVVERVQALRAGTTVLLVAHSTAGLAARAYTAAHAASVRGIVTIATPHAGTPLLPLREPEIADAVRVLQGVGTVGAAGGALAATLEMLGRALDGWERDAPDLPARPHRFPWAEFAAGEGLETGGVQALALGSALDEPLVSTFRQALADRLAVLIAASAAAPTHLAVALRTPIPFPGVNAGEVRVEAHVSTELFRVSLTADRPTAELGVAIAARVRLRRDEDWLAGSAGARPDPAATAPESRVREATFGVRATPEDGVQVTLALAGAGHRGVSADGVGLEHPLVDPLLGAVATALDAPGGTAAATLREALEALGLAVRDAEGAFAFSADALAALRLAPGPFFAARLGTALALPPGWLGFAGPEGGPWVRPNTLTRLARAADGGFSVTATLGGADGLALADGARLALDATWNREGASGRPLDLSLTAALGAARVTWSSTLNSLIFSADPYLDPLTLWPAPEPAARRRWVAAVVPRLLLSSAASALIEAVFGPGVRVAPIHPLLEAPARALLRPHALGDGSNFRPERVRDLVLEIARMLGLPATTGGVDLPAQLRLSLAEGPGLRFVLTTLAPFGGVADLTLAADVDAGLDAAITGQIALHLDLASAPWGRVDVVVGRSSDGLSLVVTPQLGRPIRFLPTFSGFADLAAGLLTLLPRVLDKLVLEISGTGGPLLPIALEIAAGLEIYDPVGGFAAHADRLADLAAPGALSRVGLAARAPLAASLARLFTDASSPLAGTLPGMFVAEQALVKWTSSSPGRGTLSLVAGWDTAGPRLAVTIDGLAPVGSAVLHVDVSHGAGTTALSAALDVDLASSLGVAVAPRLAVATAGGAASPALTFLPLGAGSEAILTVRLAPDAAVIADVGAAKAVAMRAATLAGRLLLDLAASELDDPLFAGGPTARAVLVGARLAEVGAAGALLPASTLPTPADALGGILEALASGTSARIDLGGSSTLSFVSTADRLGVRLRGSAEGTAGPFRVHALFEPRAAVLSDAASGVGLELLERVGADGTLALRPRLRVSGLGVELSRLGGDPLVSVAGFQLGRAAGHVFFDLPFAEAVAPAEPFGAALVLHAVSLPLGLARGGQGSGGNPVAASLLRGDGADTPAPQGAPSAAPGVDLLLARRYGETIFQIAGQEGPVWFDVERSFGPLEIKRVGVRPLEGPGLDVLVDGGVKVDGFAVQVDDLSVAFRLSDVLNPGAWRLDLAGLAVGFSRGDFSVAGGLRKDPGPPVEYTGLLLFQGAGRTVAAVGAYGRPTDLDGAYTSLFAFVAIPATLGGPPFCFVTGLAAGVGYNRVLVLPAEVDEIPAHPLVHALDAGALAADPMLALRTMRALIPARRGGFWLAAGVRFTSFGLVHSRALVYVALDGGLEVGVLGVSRMLLPSADNALVSVELALKARFSSVERILSVQAQLTDHSWIFSRDCQLTGGFALFVWFDRGEFVLTLGDYNPYFARPAHFPVVPRLGFRWQATEHAVASGTAYFALTTSCVMAGGSLSIDYRKGGLHAWFTAEADLLIAWDPFAYDVEVSVEVGVTYRFRVCFIKCWTTTIGVSLGLGLRLMGPPLRGELYIDLAVTSVTIPFGARRSVPDYLPSFSAFADRYLFAGDVAREGVRALLASGLERKNAGTPFPPGSAAQPWPVGPEALFVIESRMPATRFRLQDTAPVAPPGIDSLDLAPMGDVQVSHSELSLRLERQEGTGWVSVSIDPTLVSVEPVTGPVPEATWRFRPPKEIDAAGNNLTALVGVRLRAAGRGRAASAAIPVASIATDDPVRARPLPFARRRPIDFDRWHAAGVAAETMAAIGAGATGERVTGAADALLASDPRFSAARAEVGLPPAGLSPHGRRSLVRGRSAPPAIAPLAIGLTMRAVGLPPAPPRPPVRDAVPVALDAPRLRAVLRPSVAPSPGARTVRTTVRASSVVRTAAPALTALSDAELVRLAPSAGARDSRAAHGGLELASGECGAGAGPAHAEAIALKQKALPNEGSALGAGVTEVWDLPGGAGASLRVRGTSALRVTTLSRGGAVLADVDLPATPDTWSPYELPAGAARIALTALGLVAVASPLARRRGERVLGVAGGRRPIAGFTATLQGVRIADRVVLVPGAHLCLPRADDAGKSEALASIAQLMAGALAIETRLPLSTELVVVLVDEVDPTAAARGDVRVSVRGTDVAAPVVETLGARRALLYRVVARDGDASAISVTIGSQRGLRVAAVLGTSGTVDAAATWLRQVGFEVTLSGGPASSAGEVRVRFVSPPRRGGG